jgi:hypothetical protein
MIAENFQVVKGISAIPFALAQFSLNFPSRGADYFAFQSHATTLTFAMPTLTPHVTEQCAWHAGGQALRDLLALSGEPGA